MDQTRTGANVGSRFTATEASGPKAMAAIEQLTSYTQRIGSQIDEIRDMGARLDAFTDSLVGQRPEPQPGGRPIEAPAPNGSLRALKETGELLNFAIARMRETFARLGI